MARGDGVNDELQARLAADIANMFAPAESVEPPEIEEPEAEPPTKGNVIPSAGQKPGYEQYAAIGEQVNPEDKYEHLARLLGWQ